MGSVKEVASPRPPPLPPLPVERHWVRYSGKYHVAYLRWKSLIKTLIKTFLQNIFSRMNCTYLMLILASMNNIESSNNAALVNYIPDYGLTGKALAT